MNKLKVVVPARFGSSRLPGKPLLTILGKPIFWHVYQRVLEAGIPASDIVIATDDLKIHQTAIELDVPSLMTRKSHDSGTDRLNEVAEKLNWDDDTLVINVQGDEPLIPGEVISQLAHFSLNSGQFDIFTVVTPLIEKKDFLNPNVVKVVLGEIGRAIYFSRSPIPFNRDSVGSLESCYRHVGIYAYTVESLRRFCNCRVSDIEKLEKLEQLRALSYGLTIGATVVGNAPPHGIDTKEDYLTVKNIMESEE
ncbi:3-deoxy-manno-octulosonate cytidylyltransferase [Vibrio sp. B1Z05]|nr:3-deoxy-manno-octulosonate cytidylyltransferase [Vibrio sp. B1Z05]